MQRRTLLAGLGALAASPVLAQAPTAEPLEWHDVRKSGLEGKGWSDSARYFDRLPARAEQKVRPAVWNLSRHSAGMACFVETDSPVVHVRYTLLSGNLAMPHMPATGVSGIDLYGELDGRLRWIGVTRPAAREVEAPLAANLDPRKRRLAFYLPLYNGVDSLEIGVRRGSAFQPLPPRRERQVVFYGTSIMHGACASRPGMSISALIGRRLDIPTLNLGFSGNGQMEESVADFLVELDPAVYAIDCLPNMTPQMVAERTVPLVRKLRAARPQASIVLVEDRTFTNSGFFAQTRSLHRQRREALRKAYDQLRRDGEERLYYLEGEPLLGDDGEAATDGSHPNDLGMVRYAEAYIPVIRRALQSRR